MRLGVDYDELMHILSRPRPNGSAAERHTRLALLEWLGRRNISYRLHTFRLYPYFFILIGYWLILSRTLLGLAIWLRWGWPALPIALIGLAGGLVDVALNIPLVTWIGARRGENILITFNPAQDKGFESIATNPQQEVILCAHYDSKTELLDHRQRLFFIKNLRLGIMLTLLLGILGPIDRMLADSGSPWAALTYGFGIVSSLVLSTLAWGLGLNLSMGWLRKPSQGAVDNGAACAILLGLADKLRGDNLAMRRTLLTLAIFTGEEVNMQGSRAYAASREWPLPTVALNLEVMAQDGEIVYWEQDGTSLKLVPTSPALNERIKASVEQVTGQPARPVGPVNSDGYSFIRVGIPATTIGTYDRVMVDRGFHQASDNLNRVVMDRLPQAVEILEHFLKACDAQGIEEING
jgi:hypothetical protein